MTVPMGGGKSNAFRSILTSSAIRRYICATFTESIYYVSTHATHWIANSNWLYSNQLH